MKLSPNSELLQALSDAHKNGYTQDFMITNNTIYCYLNPAKHYGLNDLYIRPVSYPHSKTTLYLIETKDGLLKGTLADHSEIIDL